MGKVMIDMDTFIYRFTGVAVTQKDRAQVYKATLKKRIPACAITSGSLEIKRAKKITWMTQSWN